jgi:hypothetical protein
MIRSDSRAEKRFQNRETNAVIFQNLQMAKALFAEATLYRREIPVARMAPRSGY